MSFVPASIKTRLASLDQDSADREPFGIVKVDDSGTIEIYNRWEAEMAGVEQDRAVGKNFFTQIAPCTNNRLVFGKFRKGVEAGELDETVNYTFTYKMKPTNVVLHLFHDRGSKSNWVFVQKRAA